MTSHWVMMEFHIGNCVSPAPRSVPCNTNWMPAIGSPGANEYSPHAACAMMSGSAVKNPAICCAPTTKMTAAAIIHPIASCWANRFTAATRS